MIFLFLDWVYNFNEGSSSFDWSKFAVDVLTLAIAYFAFRLSLRVYRHQDVRKDVLSKQLRSVLELYQSLESLEFEIWKEKTPEEGGWQGGRIEFKFDNIEKILNTDFVKEAVKNKNLIVSDGIFNLGFTEYHNNFFIPISIASHLKKFAIRTFDEAKKPFDKKDFVVFKKPYESVETEKPMVRIIANPTYKTVEAYLKNILKLKVEIKKWFESKGGKELNI